MTAIAGARHDKYFAQLAKRFGGEIRTPMLMGIDSRKAVTVRLDPELHARAYDEARRRKCGDGDALVGPFCAWCVRMMVTVGWLSPENRDFLEGMRRELGRPWTICDLTDYCVSTVRKEVRGGRLRLTFWSGQINNPKNDEAR